VISEENNQSKGEEGEKIEEGKTRLNFFLSGIVKQKESLIEFNSKESCDQSV
jgi:hypothetical protein